MTMRAWQAGGMRAARLPRRAANAAVASFPGRTTVAVARAAERMRRGAQRGMVATERPGNRYKDASRTTHG